MVPNTKRRRLGRVPPHWTVATGSYREGGGGGGEGPSPSLLVAASGRGNGLLLLLLLLPGWSLLRRRHDDAHGRPPVQLLLLLPQDSGRAPCIVPRLV
jgi:hypothetical protein